MKRIKPKVKPSLRKRKEPEIKTPLTKSSLEKFKGFLIAHKQTLLANLNQMEKESLSKPIRESSGDLSNAPIHLGDLGTDQYEQDFTIGVMEGESGQVAEINAALQRIMDKTYGVCETCRKAIPVSRLKAVPFARLCIKCKETEEKLLAKG